MTVERPEPVSRPWDDVACTTVHYGAWNTGTRTMYETPIPLWEEIVRSGHPYYGSWGPPVWTAFPPKLPKTMPPGSTGMGMDDHGFGEFAYVAFAEEEPAFRYAMGLSGPRVRHRAKENS